MEVSQLYTYAVLLVTLWSVLFALDEGLSAVLGSIGGGRAVIDVVRPCATVAVNALVWA